MRIVYSILGLVALGILAGVIWLNTSTLGRIYLPSGTGIVAKQTCSLAFVSGLDADRARALYLDPLLGDVSDLVGTEIDYEQGEVTASIFGLFFKQTAVHREGLGCTLVHGDASFDRDAAVPLSGQVDGFVLNTQHAEAHFDMNAISAGLDAAFADDGRNTLAVVILHQGELVAERYADGVTAQSPLHGWSMTKSVAATMAGVLTHRDLIDVYAAGQIPSLREAGRPDITVDHLLRMTGGLAGYENNDGTDPNSDMLFTESDMATFAATRERIAEPGAVFDYQSGNTVLAGSALEEFLGDTPQEEIETIRAWLFEPLGMHHSILEPDESGTLMWSSYMYASARDWARLGQLYLDGGRAPGGEQLIPQDWFDYVNERTPGSNDNYGSGFWMYDVGLPEDNFMMNGFQGQLGYIIPSEDLVVVRLGATNFRGDGSPQLVEAVIGAKLDRPAREGFDDAPQPG